MNQTVLAGDMIDAAIVANVTDHEGRAAVGNDGHTHETACLNCGTALTGKFCHACGQAAHVHRTLGAFFHDLMHGVFHFEGRIWHTLPMLLLRPGALTRRYIDGQRARYVSPLALFLFCVFIMFAVIQQVSETPHFDQAGVQRMQSEGLAKINAQLADAQTERRAQLARHVSTADSDRTIAGLNAAATALKTGKVPRIATDTPGLSFHSDWAFANRIVAAIKDNPGLVLYKVETHAYKYSWLLIPISVPFVWLLFPFSRRFPLYDHTVFVTFSLCFMTLLSAFVMMGSAVGLDWVGTLFVFAPPVHMYRQLRGTYHCSRAGAVVRTIALLSFATIALLIFAGLMVIESAD